MDNKKNEAIDTLTEMILNLPLPEHAPADLKLSREMLRFSHKVHDALVPASMGKDEELCAKLYKVLKESNDKILALCNGEAVPEAPVKEESKTVFQVGQRVQFKTWEEMEKEFGLNLCGSIDCKFAFPENMKDLCGTQATIKKFDSDGTIILTDCENSNAVSWSISADMLKPVQEV